MRKIVPILAPMLLGLGCAPARTVTSTDTYSPIRLTNNSLCLASPGPMDKPDGSLLPSDRAVLDDLELNYILATSFALHRPAKLAIMRFTQERYWYWWSDSLALPDEEIVNRIKSKFLGSKSIREASLLPSMLTPDRPSVPVLREAAARFQSDLLLLYRMNSSSTEKERLFAPGEAKGYCLVESLLLDTRTGIVPFTATAQAEYTIPKGKDDFDLAETSRKARVEAMAQAMEKIADKLIAFLDSVPDAPTEQP